MDMPPEKDIEPSEPNDEVNETQPTAEPEAVAPLQAEEQSSALDERLAGVTSTVSEPEPAPHRPSFDEALGEMRQTLREEETKEKTGFGAGVKRWVQKVLRRKTAPLPEVTEARLDEFAIPEAKAATTPQPPSETTPEQAGVAEVSDETAQAVEEEPQRPATEASSFQKLVANRITGALPGKERMEPLVAQPEAAAEDDALDFLAPGQTHLREQPEEPPQVELATGQSILTAIRGEEEEAQEVSSIRQAALEDYVVAPAEEAAEAAPLPRRIRRGWRDMRPIDRTLLTGVLALLGVVVIGLSGYAIGLATGIIGGAPATPPATPTTSFTPYPISLTLPGIPPFPLKTGYVQNGTWNPTGPEWLSGTEVCRWVSLPWNAQREAVIRTLNADDPIQLSMSNYDSVTYKVKSIQQVTLEQIQGLAKDTPCLLVILSNEKTPTRWVVTAKP